MFFQGNYDSYVQTRLELLENQMKRYKKEQDEIAHMKVHCVPYHPHNCFNTSGSRYRR